MCESTAAAADENSLDVLNVADSIVCDPRVIDCAMLMLHYVTLGSILYIAVYAHRFVWYGYDFDSVTVTVAVSLCVYIIKV